MEFVLLLIAAATFVANDFAFHTVALLAHVVGSAWIAWVLLRRQPLTAFFIVAYVAMYCLNPLAIAIDWVPMDSDDNVYFTCNSLVLVGLDLFIIAARRFRTTHLDANRISRFSLPAAPTELCLLACLAVCGVATAALFLGVGASGANVLTVGKEYRATGGSGVYYLAAVYCFMLLPLGVFLIGLKKLVLQLPYLLLVGVLLAVHSLIFQVRTTPVACLMAYGVAVIAKTHVLQLGASQLRGRLPTLLRVTVFATVLSLPIFVVGFKYWRYRHALSLIGGQQVQFDYILGHTFAGGDLGYTYFTRRALEIFPEQHGYMYGQSYYRLLFVPIPRAIWPGKPENTERIFAALLDSDLGAAGVTIPPGIVGDLYSNFGPIGVLGMLAFGFFFALERYRSPTDLMILAASGYWIFHLCRGSLTNPVVTLICIWAASYVFTRIIKPTPIAPAPPELPPHFAWVDGRPQLVRAWA